MKGMATHSGILAWEIEWAEQPGGLRFMEPQRVGHNRIHAGHNQSVSSVAQSCLSLCDPTDRSTPGFAELAAELAQTHVQQVRDAIQPSHPLLSPSPPAFKLSQHQRLFH